ncbi:MAG: alpha/beta hydrolase [Actinobacteria bacterium]|nr:alpha/beta hydrolase [Actinomycetota bacterium]
MTVHPQAQGVLDRAATMDAPPFYRLSPTEARHVYDSFPDFSAAPEPVAHVEDVTIPGPGGPLEARIYRSGAGAVEAPPLLLYLHGGGWVMGGIDPVDSPLRALANRSGAVICSLAYRLAPETPFPGPLEDALVALSWLAGEAPGLGADGERIVVGGDSAGGNLAAAAALSARQGRGPRPAGQILIYPVMDFDFDTASYREHAEGFGLTRESMRWYWDCYASTEARSDPLAAPLQAADLAGLPPALVISAEHDVLRDEAEAYARRLEAAGVPVTLSRYDGMVHGFFRMAGAVDAGSELIDEIAGWLRALPGA